MRASNHLCSLCENPKWSNKVSSGSLFLPIAADIILHIDSSKRISEIILVRALISAKLRAVMKLALTVISAAFCLCLFLTSCGEKEPASSAETSSTQASPEETPKTEPGPAQEPEETPEPTPEPEETPEPTPEPEETPEPTPEPEETPESAPEPEETPESTPEPEETPEPAPDPEETSEPAPEPEETAEPAAKRRNRSKIPPPAIIDRTVKPVAPAPR
tara:strand:- start:198 stop:851 length:654 start_codon:yes stop_codon:yes gene_type:complete